MFHTVLVANRGEIARRVIRGVHAVGARAVAVYSDADAQALHVKEADEAMLLGPAPAHQSYLDGTKVIQAARRSGARAIHPGYGFLAENADFADSVQAAGLAWVGPSPESIRLMGDKINARNLMAAAGVPVAPGTAEPQSNVESAVAAARVIGYPVMVKASAGGGGIGMGVATDEAGLRSAFDTARTRAERFFGSPAILLERYIPHARHVEVQVLGMNDGRVVALGERDCSVQRRHQKVAEETPSPGVSAELRARMLAAAVRAATAVDYRGAGTVECLVDEASQGFVFLEMNTRLQVEHPVTELVTGLDLVAEQLRIAAGDPPSFDCEQPPTPSGHAIELRVYAEDPVRFLPGPGTITAWDEPAGPESGSTPVTDRGTSSPRTTTRYWPSSARGARIVAGMARLRDAVATFTVTGCKNNLPFFTELLSQPAFVSGTYDTDLIAAMRP